MKQSNHDRWTVVHDWMFVPAGAEVVTSALAKNVLRNAPVRYIAGSPDVTTSLRLPPGSAPLLPDNIINKENYRYFTPIYPALLRSLAPIRGNILASSYAFAHHLRCTGIKVVYCHSPLRQIWSGAENYQAEGALLNRIGLRLTTPLLRRLDRSGSNTATAYIAASRAVASRIEDYYGRSQVPVVTPPVDDNIFRFEPSLRRGDDYLWVGRITEPYKRLRIVLEAFRSLPTLRLVVAGDGPDRAALERIAPRNVAFVGWKNKSEIAKLYQSARGVVFASEDDFGLVPVEAMSCGASLIAYNGGGAAETVVEGKSGLLFEAPTPEAIRNALQQHSEICWQSELIAASAAQYSLESFVTKMQESLLQIIDENVLPDIGIQSLVSRFHQGLETGAISQRPGNEATCTIS